MSVDVVPHVAGRLAAAVQVGERVGEMLVDLAQGRAEFQVVGPRGRVGEEEAVCAGLVETVHVGRVEEGREHFGHRAARVRGLVQERGDRVGSVVQGLAVEGGLGAVDQPDASYDTVVTSLMLHHLPEDLRPTALRQIHRVLRPGGRLLVVEFRPPKSVIGRRLVHGGAGHAMAHHRVDLLDGLIVDAGFEVSGHGDVRPWLYYGLRTGMAHGAVSSAHGSDRAPTTSGRRGGRRPE
ncbi:methyltransferase family protein [Streptomyces puniciscabiei]|uniref:Methyltransferase family protein n=1 Tax=Streptomyces puniciscabiei TaxID=164348 RepID=A0A542SWW0_9ACTN|nr:methyltransferase domain-containing protein [Streptomyces puniciscabiei]TQK79083.1 methyltransferase family protein [Streptomyces puniciscabiei]